MMNLDASKLVANFLSGPRNSSLSKMRVSFSFLAQTFCSRSRWDISSQSSDDFFSIQRAHVALPNTHYKCWHSNARLDVAAARQFVRYIVAHFLALDNAGKSRPTVVRAALGCFLWLVVRCVSVCIEKRRKIDCRARRLQKSLESS
eukprot:3587187-Pleurochrysis_carterae.AAC.5